MKIEGNENKFLKEINQYQMLLAKKYRTLMQKENDPATIEHIHLLREQETKLLNAVTGEDAFCLSEILLSCMNITSSEINILKNKQTFFSSNRRLLQELITIMSEDDDFDIYLDETVSADVSSFLSHNCYGVSVTDPFGNFLNLNKCFCEDHAYLFLGLLEQNKEKISKKEYKRIYYEFLYLYPNIFENIIDKNRKITRESSQILANSYRAKATFFDEKYDYNSLWEIFCYYPYYKSMENLSTIKDDELEQTQTKRKFLVYQLYLQSLLETVPYKQIPNIITVANQLYDDGPKFFNEENQKALKTANRINHDVYETAKQKTYQK